MKPCPAWVGFVDHEQFDAGEQEPPRSVWSSSRPGSRSDVDAAVICVLVAEETPPISSATLSFARRRIYRTVP